MARGDKIKKSSELVFDKPHGFFGPSWQEYIQSEYEISDGHHKLKSDNIARYNELKKQSDANSAANAKAFDDAMKKIKQEMIASDESSDNSVLYTAMAKFKKTNE